MKELDKRILLQLLKDGGQSILEIARKVGASRQTVAKKLREFRDSGAVEGLAARLNPEKFGLRTRAYVFLQEDSRAELRRENERAIMRFHQVSGFHRLYGRYSAILEVWAEDSRELSGLIKRIHGLRGVRETETFIVHSTVKEEPEKPFVRVLKSG